MDKFFFYTDILMALSFAFITFFSHYFFEKNIAKSISPGIFFVLTIQKALSVYTTPFDYQNGYAWLIIAYLFHTIIDCFFIYQHKSLLIHHIVTFIPGLFSLFNYNLRNITIVFLGSDIFPVITAIYHNTNNKKIKCILNIIRIIIIIFYRLPFTILILQGLSNILFILTSIFLVTDIYWAFLMIRKVNKELSF
jgi:hypothetical protein